MQPTTRKDQGQAKDALHNVADKAKDAAHTVADKAKDAAQNVADSTRDMASQAGQALSGAASTVGKKAEEWTSAAGHRVESLADTVRQQGPNSGMFGKANEAVAESLEKAGEYMSDKNLSGMMDDMTSLIKRNPIPALLVGLGIGYLLARSMRR
jgi:ElaB/YqjD/DUF883 family membrane-anchored ribosome-binding protein